MTCPVYGQFCLEHNFVHGAEAEELREGIEGILDTMATGDTLTANRLRALLNRVDARDSVAYGAHRKQTEAVDDTICDECKNVIPAVTEGGLFNRHHQDSCSLWDPTKE